MTEVERYKEIIITALEVQNLKEELKNSLVKLSSVMTGREIVNKDYEWAFQKDYAFAALHSLLDENKIDATKNEYVGSILFYKLIKISLHHDFGKFGSNSINQILKEISANEILRT